MSFRISKNYREHSSDKGNRITKQIGSNAESLSSGLSFSTFNVKSINNKGINLDDTTIVLTPSSHNPPQSGDTFPSNWLGVGNTINTIRTYHYSQGVQGKSWVLWAVQNNLKVMVGLDLGNDDIAAFSADYLAASPALKNQYDLNVIAIAVGNEQTDIAAMNTGILNAKNLRSMNQLPNCPVTSVLLYSSQFIQNDYPPDNATFTTDFLTLSPNLDLVCFNCYGGYFSLGNLPPLTPAQDLQVSLSWTSNSLENSVLLNQFGAVRSAMSAAAVSLPFWCTETGWDSRPIGPETLVGWSSVPHLKSFYGGFLGFDLSSTFLPQASSVYVNPPDFIFYYSVRDTPSRPEYFGLYGSSATLAPKF